MSGAPRAVLIGASGMVGQAVINEACNAQRTVLSLIPVTRRPLEPPMPDAISGPISVWREGIAQAAGNVLISCLGTTIKTAGSQAAFRDIDLKLLLEMAKIAHENGARHMISVSSVGASAKSSSFYLQTKGEAEAGLRAIGFDRLDIMRPGLLVGDRQGPSRPGEALAMRFAPLTDALLHGPMRRYRSISATIVARAILSLAAGGGVGTYIHEHDAITALAD